MMVLNVRKKGEPTWKVIEPVHNNVGPNPPQ